MATLRFLLPGLLMVAGCALPTMTSDGQFVWTPGAARGATVLTANGVEFIDRTDTPRPVVRQSPYEPYRPATGFLVPSDGRWHRKAQPVSFQAGQFAVTIRTGDSLVPSWGGELLLEMTLSSLDTPATIAARRPPERAALGALPVSVLEEETSRAPLRLVLLVDGASEATAGQVCAALSRLSGDDQVAIVDDRGPRVITPLLDYGHRSLIEGALRQRLAARPAGARDLPAALALVRERFFPETAADAPTVVVVSDEASSQAALGRVLPAPLATSLREVKLSVSSSPAPAHVIEVTAGQTGSSLDEDEVFLAPLAASEVRTEMLRVTVPPFVAGEAFRLALRFEGRDAVSGAPFSVSHRISLRYTDDVEALARERSGDVFAYASALSLVRKLDRSLFGDITAQPGGMRRLVDWERSALDHLARDTSDPSLQRRAELLQTLAWSLDP